MNSVPVMPPAKYGAHLTSFNRLTELKHPYISRTLNANAKREKNRECAERKWLKCRCYRRRCCVLFYRIGLSRTTKSYVVCFYFLLVLITLPSFFSSSALFFPHSFPMSLLFLLYFKSHYVSSRLHVAFELHAVVVAAVFFG